MIPLTREYESYNSFNPKPDAVLKPCFFCSKLTPWWHPKTLSFICQDCSRIHKVKELTPVKKTRKKSVKRSNAILNWQAIRNKILSRDNFKCRICHNPLIDVSLEVHHIDVNRANNTEDNLVTLCHQCHSQVHMERFLPLGYAPWDVNKCTSPTE